jgi:predicted alpha/beta hydrolase family esterase
MKLVIFVPGYLTSQTCFSVGDTYLDCAEYARAYGFQFEYVPMPNNNYGDRGNTTMDDCLDHVVDQYNNICINRIVGPDDTIILAGHSMGGLIVSKLLTASHLSKIRRRPDFVRLVNPAFEPTSSLIRRATALCVSFLPEVILGSLVLPIPIAAKGMLFPGSQPQVLIVKQILAISLLGKTGLLFTDNTQWDLTPEVGMRTNMVIIACKDDPLTAFKASEKYADTYNIRFTEGPRGFHEYFNEVTMAAFFDLWPMITNPSS